MEFLDITIFDKVLDESLSAYEYGGYRGHHGEINTNSFVIGLLKTMEEIYQEKTIMNTSPLDVNQILKWNILVTYIYNLLSERKHKNEGRDDYNSVDKKIKNVISTTNKEEFWDYIEEIFSGYRIEKSFERYANFYSKVQECLQCAKEIGNFKVDFTIPKCMIENLSERKFWKYMMPYVPRDGKNFDINILLVRAAKSA